MLSRQVESQDSSQRALSRRASECQKVKRGEGMNKMGLVVEHSPDMYEVLGFVPSITRMNKDRRGKREEKRKGGKGGWEAGPARRLSR